MGDWVGDAWNEITGTGAKNRALDSQSAATNQANQTLQNVYGQQQDYLNPYSQAGGTALSSLVNNDFMNNWQTDPGYQFRLDEGNKAINNAAAARGLGNSGATLKALTQYGQDYASNEFQKVYDRNANRLSTLLGVGTNATNNLANAAGAYGSNISNNLMGMGNASAAAEIGQWNTLAGLGGQGAQAYGMSSAGGAAAFSDERLKKNITPISKEDLEELKKELRAFYFEYKDQIHGEGRWIGIMAQDLEKSKLGKSIVVENAKGEKMIDMHKVNSIFLATMAEAA